MFDIQKFKTFNFEKSVIEDVGGGYSNNPSNSFLTLQCKFSGAAECPYFDLGFESFDKNLDLPKDLNGAEISGIDITEGEDYSVKLDLLINGKPGKIDFLCKKISFRRLKYRGFSYRNMYDIWHDELNKKGFVESADYLDSEKTHEFDGFTLNEKIYIHPESNDDKRTEFLKVFELTAKNFTYSFRVPTWNKEFKPYEITLDHSNGHRYFPFSLAMYGISYIDIDSGEVYNYIPEGFEHDIDDPMKIGESFIIRDIHYDPKTNLIAYTGCYWAGSDDVMVGDFSDPLNFDPHLVSVDEILTPSGQPDYEDVFFARFEDGKLVVSCDGLFDREVSSDVLMDKIKSMGAKS